jgi:hypothetical protein
MQIFAWSSLHIQAHNVAILFSLKKFPLLYMVLIYSK